MQAVKDFAYGQPLEATEAEKVVQRLIRVFFRGHMLCSTPNNSNENTVSFSYKRPFGCESGQPQLVRPHRLGELFPHQMLYMLRHYVYDGLQLPVFTALSSEIQHDLEDVDSIDFHEHAYIFDKNFLRCFYVMDSCNLHGNTYEAILTEYAPLDETPV